MRLILVRHGETEWNRGGRFQGQSSVGLNQRGLAQARQTADALVPMKPSVLYSSPLPRTLSTAQEISRKLSLPVAPLEGIKEVNLGELEGITGEEMRSRYPQIYSAWREDPSDMDSPPPPPPGGGGGSPCASFKKGPGRPWRASKEHTRRR